MIDAPKAPVFAGSRVAFFGGSFDPPHRGHLAIAHAARAALALDTVLFAPVGTQPLKPAGSTAPFADRVSMTQLAIAGEPGFALSLVDAPSPTGVPNYTIDTLHALRAQLPSGGALFCLLGGDSFLNLHQWHRGAQIPFAAELIVAARPGQPLADLAAALPAGLTLESGSEQRSTPGGIDLRTYTLRSPSGAAAPFHLLPGLHYDISATSLRRQIRSAAADPADLSPAVLAYIRQHGLYRNA